MIPPHSCSSCVVACRCLDVTKRYLPKFTTNATGERGTLSGREVSCKGQMRGWSSEELLTPCWWDGSLQDLPETCKPPRRGAGRQGIPVVSAGEAALMGSKHDPWPHFRWASLTLPA